VKSLPDIAEVNGLTDITSGGNVSIDLVGGDWFVDADGDDEDITTMPDNDWRLVDDAPVEARRRRMRCEARRPYRVQPRFRRSRGRRPNSRLNAAEKALWLP
jgi:hypothetical protein